MMVTLVVFIVILVIWSIATRRYIHNRAQGITEEKQQAIDASETRAGGHVWLLGTILTILLGIGMVLHLHRTGLDTGSGWGALGILVICTLIAIHCGVQAVLAYRHARSIKQHSRW
jgi:ABC-type uncharacterized transport system permease subunit